MYFCLSITKFSLFSWKIKVLCLGTSSYTIPMTVSALQKHSSYNKVKQRWNINSFACGAIQTILGKQQVH